MTFFSRSWAGALEHKGEGRLGLDTNNFFYEIGLDFAETMQRKGLETHLAAVSHIGRLASRFHPGRFADGALENPVLLDGYQLSMSPTSPSTRWRKPASRASTLHVASELYRIGGHSRVLVKWIQRDRSSCHRVVLTNQSGSLPAFVLKSLDANGVEVICLDVRDSFAVRAGLLRVLASECDRVVLHTHQEDVIPVLAFAAPGGPPVAMFNHAHFSFCLCATIADITINTFEYFSQVSRSRRQARRTFVLPLTTAVEPLSMDEVDKAAALRQIAMAGDMPVMMTIASEKYFRPANGYDFFKTAHRLLSANPRAHLLMVGVRESTQFVPRYLKGNTHVHFIGPVDDPRPYFRASDVCLESFPMPSLGALVESVAEGEAFPVPAYGPRESILRVQQAPLLTFDHCPESEDEYVEFVSGLLNDLGETRRRARFHRQAIVEFDEEWHQRLGELNSTIDSLKHKPSTIANARMQNSADDRELAGLREIDLGVEINKTFPGSHAICNHLVACLRGFQSPALTVRHLAYKCAGVVDRALHKLKFEND